MLFLIRCEDAEGASTPREQALAEHLSFVEANMDRIRVAGPVKDAEDRTVASAYIVEAADQADAEAFLASDPYFAAGVWQSTTIAPFLGVAGTWVGGKNW